MSTKTIVIGVDQKEMPDIHFLKQLQRSLGPNNEFLSIELTPAALEPKSYKFIELICRNYFPNLDLMFAYDDPKMRSLGSLYIGQWNDGVVADKIDSYL